ncbi:MAG: molybdate ABC transporter permease subunit [Planctomycetota bacterium]|nr:MAG: molybdate ABC transporter permease subunit [Planctomycetota bacterium]
MPSLEPETLDALLVSLEVASFAMLLDVVPGLGLAYLLARKEWRGKSLVETLVTLPLVLPPVAVGFLLLFTFGREGPLGSRALGIDLDLILTWKGAVLASAVMSLPLVVRTARVAFEGVNPRLESMGRSLGLARTRVFLTITLPLARRGLFAALVLGFGRALGEFGATVIIAGNIPGKTQTLALAIFDNYQLGHEREALRLVGLTAVIAFLLIWFVERLLASGAEREGPR